MNKLLLTWLKELENKQHEAKKLLRDHSKWVTKYLIPVNSDNITLEEAKISALQQSFHFSRYRDVEERRKILKRLNEIRKEVEDDNSRINFKILKSAN